MNLTAKHLKKVALKLGYQIEAGILAAILKRMGITREELEKLLQVKNRSSLQSCRCGRVRADEGISRWILEGSRMGYQLPGAVCHFGVDFTYL